VKKFSGNDVVLVDPDCLNYAVFNNIPKEITLVERRNPTILMKAIKNEVELQHTIKAHVKDGIAISNDVRRGIIRTTEIRIWQISKRCFATYETCTNWTR